MMSVSHVSCATFSLLLVAPHCAATPHPATGTEQTFQAVHEASRSGDWALFKVCVGQAPFAFIAFHRFSASEMGPALGPNQVFFGVFFFVFCFVLCCCRLLVFVGKRRKAKKNDLSGIDCKEDGFIVGQSVYDYR